MPPRPRTTTAKPATGRGPRKTTPTARTPKVIDGNVVEVPAEPIPGVSLADLRTMVNDARRHPESADATIDGIRSLIEENGHDPDTVLAEALKTDPEPGNDETTLAGAVVPFHGRDIKVALPTIEQLVVMRRLADQYRNVDGKQLTSAQDAINGYDRALMSITSVIVDPEDVVFVENLLLQGKTDLTGAGVLLREAMDALQAANADAINREERRRQNRTKGSRGTARLATR